MSLVRFDPKQDVRVQTDKIITSTWSDNTNNLQSVYTSSQQTFTSATSSAQFYLNVYHKSTDPSFYTLTSTTDQSDDAEVQFSVGYGNRHGSGSPDFTNDTGSFGKSASRVVYGQYRQLVYGEENQNFTFGTHVPDDFYVINVNRARYKNNLSLSTLSLYLTSSIADADSAASSYKVTHLTDDSISSNGAAVITNIGRQFNIVSGSNGVHSGSSAIQVGGSASFGLYYPDAGIILLNPDAFHSGSGGDVDSGGESGFPQLYPGRNPGLSTNTDKNPERLFNSISGAGHFIIDSEEVITSQYYFVRAKNYEFNYTTNPSFQDEKGNVNFSSMINNPKTFITTVGMYNDNGDLLAVAKMSQPIAKDPTKEALFRIKLDF